MPLTEILNRFEQREKGLTNFDTTSTDICSKLLQIQSEKPNLNDGWVRNMCLTNFGAGVETTAIVVSTFIVNVLSHRGCQDRIHKEIDSARKAGTLSNPPKLRELKEHLPYMNACLNESMRLHAVVGMPLVRVVPDGGCELEGKFLPAGVSYIRLLIIPSRSNTYGC